MDHAFEEKERGIFPYFNGFKEVKGDPLEIKGRYLRHMAGEDFDELDRCLKGGDVQAVMRAADKMLPAIRAAFRLEPFDEDTGAGLTRAETTALFNRFLAWESDLKADTGPGPDTSGPTADGPAAV